MVLVMLLPEYSKDFLLVSVYQDVLFWMALAVKLKSMVYFQVYSS
jgi:hypothetical protein